MPETVVGVAAAMLEIERSGLPPALLAGLKHLASLHNPAFYEKERLRFSTWDTPRMIRCYGESLKSLLLPRGLSEKAAGVVAEAGSRLVIHEARPDPEQIEFTPTLNFAEDRRGCASRTQRTRTRRPRGPARCCEDRSRLRTHCHHRRPTLIIVDRKPLVEQWTERLATHLGLAAKEIGQVGGGRNKTTGIVDIAMAQGLARREDLDEMSSRYGLVVVDECHHVPAVTFERCVKQIRARRWLGLTATPYRRDGLQGLITMYCGPIRYRMDEKVDAENDFSRELIVHQTNLEVSDDLTHIQELFRALVDDEARTMAICDDMVAAAAKGRNCLVLTQWTEHLSSVVAALTARGITPLVLQGGMGKKARAKVMADLDDASKRGGLVLTATGSFLGEGFDCPLLDTVFMAFPIAFVEELSSTLAGSCDPWMVSLPLKSTITWTLRARCSHGCTERDSQDMPPSVSMLVRIARIEPPSNNEPSVGSTSSNLEAKCGVASLRFGRTAFSSESWRVCWNSIISNVGSSQIFAVLQNSEAQSEACGRARRITEPKQGWFAKGRVIRKSSTFLPGHRDLWGPRA